MSGEAPSRAPGPKAGSIDGCVVVDKPPGMTSHDVVARCRRVLGEARAGHAGTLDPDATGVLVIGLGRATRLLGFVSGRPKSYSCELVLGSATTTLDAGGEVVATFDMAGVTLGDVREVARRFTGRIQQVPPMVSALKRGGRRLHELAREGVEVAREPRAVEVTRLEVDGTDLPGVFRLEVDCSSGTYVRSLAADLGAALGGGAHLRRLRRLAVGRFSLGSAVPLALLDRSCVRPASELVGHLARLVPDAAVHEAIAHGRVLERRVLGATGDGPWAVLDAEGSLLAVYEAWPGERAKPSVVLWAGPGTGSVRPTGGDRPGD